MESPAAKLSLQGAANEVTCGSARPKRRGSTDAAGQASPAAAGIALRENRLQGRHDACDAHDSGWTPGFWLAGACQAPLLRRAVGSNVVVEADAQVEVRAFELRRKRLERARGANRGSRGGIERLFARRPINAEAFGGKTSIVIDAERNRDDSLVPQVKRFRHHRDPILLQLREQPIDVTLENPRLRWE